ncbi:MAG: 30S ribosomal protein S6 [Phycisphaera sp.]|nr:MAG: 30S ribosomal protein S6 [Phycisphaera sp.]
MNTTRPASREKGNQEMAEKQRINEYEGMFLISQGEAADFGGVIEHINHLFERAGAEVIAMQKWEERRLSYEIDKQKRGVYILTYFKAPAENLQAFERDCNISERVLRVLVTKADHLTLEEMQAFDRRSDLVVEAKERAQRAAEREEAGMSTSVSLGAPVVEAPPAEEPKPEESKPEAAPAEGETAPAPAPATAEAAPEKE